MDTEKYMLKFLKNHRIYESFTCRDDAGIRLKYDLLAAEPPAGLLRDIAVRETELTGCERNTAVEMFSAYCMYHGAKILGKNNPDEVLNFKLVQDAMKCAEKCLAGGKFGGFRALFANLVTWRHRDVLRKGRFRIKDKGARHDENSGCIWQSRTTPMEWSGEDERSVKMRRKVEDRIAEISLDRAVRAENIELVNETMESCRVLGLITGEQYDMLCRFYGIGGAFDQIIQTGIAKELGVSPSYVCNKLAGAYKIMRAFIECGRPAA